MQVAAPFFSCSKATTWQKKGCRLGAVSPLPVSLVSSTFCLDIRAISSPDHFAVALIIVCTTKTDRLSIICITCNNMAPTEATILTNYLLVPAQLPSIISLEEFTQYFPRAQRSSPQVRRLYRDLQVQRNALIDDVASDIEQQAKRGKALRREILRSKRESEMQDGDDEIDIERAVRVHALDG